MCCCHMALCRVESAVQLALSPHNPGDLGWEPRSAQGQVRNAAVCSPVQMSLQSPHSSLCPAAFPVSCVRSGAKHLLTPVGQLLAGGHCVAPGGHSKLQTFLRDLDLRLWY